VLADEPASIASLRIPDDQEQPGARRHERFADALIGAAQGPEVAELIGVGDRVVDRQQASRSQHAPQLRPVAGVVGSFGVKEDHVQAPVGRLPQTRGRVLYPQLHQLVQAGSLEVLCSQGAASGVYKFIYGATAAQRTVLRSATDLLLDAMREFDEGERDTAEENVEKEPS